MIYSKSLLIFIFGSFILEGCYSFKGISISPTISSFYIDQFQNAAGNAPPDIGQRFSEKLKDIVLSGSRLGYNEKTPDIEFVGSIRSFVVSSVAPSSSERGFGSSLNRLEISVQIDYLNNQDDKENWSQSFTFFQDFDANTDLISVQDELIENIFDRITQDVFNRAFTNW